MLAEPGPDLDHRVPLRRIQSIGHVWVQGGGDRQGLGSVHDHLGEPRRALPRVAGLTRCPHRLPADRGDPIDPAGVLDGRQGILAEQPSGAVDDGQLGLRDAGLQVVLVSPRAIRLEVAARGRASPSEQDHAASHEDSRHRVYLQLPKVAYVHSRRSWGWPGCHYRDAMQ